MAEEAAQEARWASGLSYAPKAAQAAVEEAEEELPESERLERVRVEAVGYGRLAMAGEAA